MLGFEVITLFPEAIRNFVATGLLGKAIRGGSIAVHATDVRDFTTDKHRTVDATPYGGGAGMLMKIEPVVLALEHVADTRGPSQRILLTPAAPKFDQRVAERLATHDRITLVCGRYEGIDDRVRDHVHESLSVGDFVLNGGEVAALAVIEAVARLREGVIGNAASAQVESFGAGQANTRRLEHPQYTRPPEFRGASVPPVLLGGDHARVDRRRRLTALRRTAELRPDLLGDAAMPEALEFGFAWPGVAKPPERFRFRGKAGEVRRTASRAIGRPVQLVTVTTSADPAGLSGSLLGRFLRELTSMEAPSSSPFALFVPPGVGEPEAALIVPETIFSLAKQASMIDISRPADPTPLLETLQRELRGVRPT